MFSVVLVHCSALPFQGDVKQSGLPIEQTICIGQPEGAQLAHPELCNVFFICEDDEAMEERCTPGSWYDNERGVCVLTTSVCKVPPPEIEFETVTTTTQSVIAPSTSEVPSVGSSIPQSEEVVIEDLTESAIDNPEDEVDSVVGSSTVAPNEIAPTTQQSTIVNPIVTEPSGIPPSTFISSESNSSDEFLPIWNPEHVGQTSDSASHENFDYYDDYDQHDTCPKFDTAEPTYIPSSISCTT